MSSSAPSLKILSNNTISSALLSDGDDLQDYKHHKRNLLFASGKFVDQVGSSSDALLISAEENNMMNDVLPLVTGAGGVAPRDKTRMSHDVFNFVHR